jgi:hypothetical protein
MTRLALRDPLLDALLMHPYLTGTAMTSTAA